MSINPVVVGVDGSADSKRALQWAVEYARRFEAPVHAVTVWEKPIPYAARVVFTEDDEGRSRAMLDETVREVLGEHSGVVQQVRQDHPARALVGASESAQLLVVGSRGHGSFVGILLGSTSQYCVQHARCPVVVMPSVATDSNN